MRAIIGFVLVATLSAVVASPIDSVKGGRKIFYSQDGISSVAPPSDDKVSSSSAITPPAVNSSEQDKSSSEEMDTKTPGQVVMNDREQSMDTAAMQSDQKHNCCDQTSIHERAHDHTNADDTKIEQEENDGDQETIKQDETPAESQDSYSFVPSDEHQNESDDDSSKANVPYEDSMIPQEPFFEISRELKPPKEDNSWIDYNPKQTDIDIGNGSEKPYDINQQALTT